MIPTAIERLFSLVCSQNPAHTSVVSGVRLPCCERCAGLYSGIAVAFGLILFLKSRFGTRGQQVHGLMLLQMVPLGFHWLPHGPLVRTASGVLYGFGLVCFLTLLPGAWLRFNSQQHRLRVWIYSTVLLATLVGILLDCRYGGAMAGWCLFGIAAAGLVCLLLLATANLALLGWLAVQGLLRRPRRSPA